MSCLHFLTPKQHEQMRNAAAMDAPLRYASPRKTTAKVKRLTQMSLSSDPRLRDAAAGNPMTQELDLGRLMFDPVESVRGWVLRNPAVRRGIIEWMAAKDESPAVRAYAKFRLDNET
jgi:hypothetical protein